MFRYFIQDLRSTHRLPPPSLFSTRSTPTPNSKRARKALYPVSVDPITWGHCDILKRAASLFDAVVLGIGINPGKRYVFSPEERVALTTAALPSLHLPPSACVSAEAFSGLTAEHAYYGGFAALIRGLRTVGDLEDELLLHAVNNDIKPAVETVLLPCKPHLAQCSSTIVRSLVAEGGNAASYAPIVVKEATERRILGRSLLGVVGSIGSGKSSFCARLVPALQRMQADPVHSISLDQVGHHVLSAEARAPCFQLARQEISEAFGVPLQEDSSIDRSALAKLAFSRPEQLRRLAQIMRQPIAARLYQLMARSHGIFVVEGATLIEAGWSSLVNNNLILVDAHPDVRLRRLMRRPAHNEEEAVRRISFQITPEERSRMLSERISQDGWGRTYHYRTDDGPPPEVESIAAKIVKIHQSATPWLHPEF